MRSRHLHYASGETSNRGDWDWRLSDVPLFLLLLSTLTATGVGGAVLVMVGLV
jgi:hypothetical protein